MAASSSLHIRDAVTPILKDLSLETSEDAFYMIAVGYNGIVIDKVDSSNNLKIVEKYGYEFNLHCGAMRKTLLAYQTDEFIEDYIKIMEEDTTCYPKFEASKLRADITRIRKEGVAVSHGEYIDGAVGIGAPVFDAKGKLKGSIGIIAPESRILEGDKIDKVKLSVKKYAEKLSYNMGYADNNGY
ncbi:IclR family transcriptional regulator [Alloiococcus sp. CFN-8]|uniref:IclR family transcriptional regulator n=1 Tax=Alloiococcus sp. CFN-8 TaxID=3416081 RepID=UPI003CED6DBE